MSERIRRPVALFVVSVLLVALAAAAALAHNNASEIRAANKPDTKHHSSCAFGTDGDDFMDDFVLNKNCLKGLKGNDVLAGWTWDDLLDGGDGDDQLFGESGNESKFAVHYIDGWNGNDKINPGSGNDDALGFSGNDVIDGNHKHDFLGNGWQEDDAGNDRLFGESGDDFIIDWVGLDQLFGGSENDTLNVRDGFSGDFVDGGPGFDTVFADSGDTVVNAESVVKSAAGAKSTADQERPTPPKVSAKSSAPLKSVR